MAQGRTTEVGIADEELLPDAVRAQLVELDHAVRYWWAGGLVAGRRALDARCGLGEGTLRLLAAGATSVTGVDDRAAVVEAARARLPERIQLESADLRHLPHGTDAFDAVVCLDLDSAGSCAALPTMLEEFARVLGDRGIMIVGGPRLDAGGETHGAVVDWLRTRYAHTSELHQHRWGASAIFTDESLAEITPLACRSGRLSAAPDASQTGWLAVASDAPLPDTLGLVMLGAPIEHERWFAREAAQRRELAQARDAQRLLTAQAARHEAYRARLRDAESRLAALIDENHVLRARLDSSPRRLLRRLDRRMTALARRAKRRVRHALR